MQIEFSRNQWNTDEITYAYSYRFEETPTFVQHDDCVENTRCSEAKYGFDNISLLTRQSYTAGTRISTRCAFEDLGAPLIVIADKLYTDSRGVVRYGDYLEVVLYKNGVNVWRMYLNDGIVTWNKVMGVEFPVTENEIHSLTVDISAQTLTILADDHKLMLRVEDLYPSYHVGINACEGYNRFYSMTVEEIKD